METMYQGQCHIQYLDAKNSQNLDQEDVCVFQEHFVPAHMNQH